ncbi:MAG: hypothetical protein AMS17_10535 [Spirochaetes bacterium DG_61]|nr:MAG: hypothetical protein AMS17_10535 [Spirochaetes bacterium DG_61]
MGINKYVLQMNNISKNFPGVKALENVSFNLFKSEVHALVGENGAGKSTLIKILSGLYQKDRGDIFIDDAEINIEGTRHAIELGISTIYQEIALVEEITVAENIFLSDRPKTNRGLIDWKKMKSRAEDILNTFSSEKIEPGEKVQDLSVARKYFVEIAKALIHKSKIIIMDESTASLSEAEINMLYDTIKTLKNQGISIIYISHRLDEIFEIADRVSVLRDGKLIKTVNVSETNKDELIKYMIGRDISEMYGKGYKYEKDVIFKVENFSSEGVFENISFELHRGEILGFAGLVGARRTEIMRALFGLGKITSGKIFIEDKPVKIRNPADAVKHGIGFVSEDRRIEGLVTSMSVKENLTPLILDEISYLGLLKKGLESKIAQKSIKDFSIKTPSLNQLVMNLSGGNQQKVVMAKGLTIAPKILILDEPTKGIDVGAKAEIHRLIKDLAKKGMGMIIVSSEMPEILGVCQRIISIRNGRIVKIFNIEEANEEVLLKAAAGYL